MNASGLRCVNENIGSYRLALYIAIIGIYIQAISVSADQPQLDTQIEGNLPNVSRSSDSNFQTTPEQGSSNKSDTDNGASREGNNTDFESTPEEELSNEIHRAVIKYRDFSLLRTVPHTIHQVNQLQQLIYSPVDGVSFWLEPTGVNRSVDIMTSPSARNNLTELLDKLKLSWSVVSDDIVEDLIGKTFEPVRQSYLASDSDSFFDTYQTLSAFGQHLQNLKKKYKGFMTVIKFATSYEKRPMHLVKLSSSTQSNSTKHQKNKKRPRTKAKKKPASSKAIIWLDAGHHAREWISQATCMYILETLLEGYTNGSKDVLDLFDKYDFYIVPVVNPDGYEYSHTNDRLWRKTRSKQENCFGVDPNRNYPLEWATVGASKNPCDQTFAGPKALSEPEVIAISDSLLKYKDRIKLYLSLHAYGQVMLSPWGHTKDLPADYDELASLAKLTTAAIESVHGTQYEYGTAAGLMYPAAGGSDDFAKGIAGIKYSYTIELRDKGFYAFNLPEELIKPVGEETYAGFIALVGELVRRKEY